MIKYFNDRNFLLLNILFLFILFSSNVINAQQLVRTAKIDSDIENIYGYWYQEISLEKGESYILNASIKSENIQQKEEIGIKLIYLEEKKEKIINPQTNYNDWEQVIYEWKQPKNEEVRIKLFSKKI